MYAYCQTLYTAEALAFDPSFIITRKAFESFLDNLVTTNVFLAFAWTAVFAVKFAFLSLFRHLVGRVSRGLVIYFWAVVAVTGLCWAFIISEPFILCPYFGLESGQS